MPTPHSDEQILTFAEARTVVEHEASTLHAKSSERVPLRSAIGRVLAEPLVADRDLPPFDRATRDGFAVRAQDVSQPPSSLRVVAEVPAGFTGQLPTIGQRECAEIMTGAPLPPGADAVEMVEYTRRDGGTVTLQRAIEKGANIVGRGTEAQRGQEVLHPGTRFDYTSVAIAASVGVQEVSVYRRPRVAIFSTGDEVVEVAARPGPTQIRNSNAWSLAAQVERAGGEAVVLPIAPDQTGRLRELISDGLKHDLLLLSGGVSLGKHDLVEPILQEMGAEFFFTGAKIQPGKPVVFGKVGDKYFFGLPGNPVSTMVCFELFARPVAEALAGITPRPLRLPLARLRSAVTVTPGLTRFLPMRFCGTSEIERAPWQGSGDVFSLAGADGWLIVPEDVTTLPAGSQIAYLPK